MFSIINLVSSLTDKRPDIVTLLLIEKSEFLKIGHYVFRLGEPLGDLLPLHVLATNLGLDLDTEDKISDLVESVLELHASAPAVVDIGPLEIDPTGRSLHQFSFMLKFFVPVDILVIQEILPGGSGNLVSLIFIFF